MKKDPFSFFLVLFILILLVFLGPGIFHDAVEAFEKKEPGERYQYFDSLQAKRWPVAKPAPERKLEQKRQ